MIETPAAWPDAQRAFHLAYLDDPAQFSRRPVRVTWVTLRQRGGVVGLARTMWWLGAGRHEGVEVTVIDGETAEAMWFSVADEEVPPKPGGSTTGVLVGELCTNAVCCVEVEGGVIWPAVNPVAAR